MCLIYCLRLAIGWHHCTPKERSSLFSGMLSLMNRITLHRFLTDCTLLHCNFPEKHDLSTPGCCPGVVGCCFADELLYSVHTEQLPPVYLCDGSSLLSSLPCRASVNERLRLTSRKRSVGTGEETLHSDCMYYLIKTNRKGFLSFIAC